VSAGLWNSLEVLSTQAALLMEWKQELGEYLAAARAFLRPTQEQVESYPCPQPICCGCRHRLVIESEDHVSALCDCEEAACDPITLRASDLIVYAMDGRMLAAAVRRAFQFDELETSGFEETRSRMVGCWGVRRSRVLFHVPLSESTMLKEIDRLCAAIPDPFILLTPTSRFCTPMVQRALRREGCAQMPLLGAVNLTGRGLLELIPAAKPTVDALLGDFGKRVAEGKPLELAIARVEEKLNAIAKSRTAVPNEAVSEDVARQTMELVKKLDAGPRLKNPSLLTVFRLYCVNNKSSREIAFQCGCSRAVVMKRLSLLAGKIGVPLVKLRTYSAQFEQMDDHVRDSRARRIDRWALAHGDEGDSES
jgi:hypothetical protein